MKGLRFERACVAPFLLSVGLLGCGRTDTVASAQSAGTTTDASTGSSGSSDSGTENTGTTTTTEGSESSTSVGGFCGNGILDDFEECDPGDGLIGPGEACLPGCVTNVCGDGDAGPGEQCDDGNTDDDDGCRNDCVLGTCNDGNVDAGEECDDGNFDDSDGCISDCTLARCGDGFTQFGDEECDDGDRGNTPFGTCTPECTLNVCGDGFQRFDEQCDPGEDQIGPGLECLDGCILNVCGDGEPWAGEACDDGNADPTDACVNCVPAQCGDGFVFEGTEDCDDGDFDDVDACHNDCTFHRATQVSLGGNHSCALFDSGNVQCWGNGNNGRTGHGDEENIGDDEPAGAAGFLSVGAEVDDMAAALSHTCFHFEGAGLICFGRGTEGQLGYGNIDDLGDDELPSALGLVPLGGSSALFGARGGAFHTCAALDGSNQLQCWGAQTFFQLGTPGVTENIGDNEPASAAGVVNLGAGTIADVVTGSRHSCVLMEDGAVRCWGRGSDGALGYGNVNDIGDGEFPSAAGDVNLGAPAVQLTAGWFHTCAITENDEVLCWGRGASGRLGYASTVSVGATFPPVNAGAVDIGPGTPVQIAAGLNHTCVRMDDGAVRCWGDASRGQLGYGNITTIGDNEAPSVAGDVDLGEPASFLDIDGNHACAILQSTGAVRCWGQGGDGRLGYGNLGDVGDNETPADAGDVPLFP